MNIRFNIDLKRNQHFNEFVCKEFVNHFSNYNISCFSDLNKIVLKRKKAIPAHLGYNVRYDINPIKYFEIKRKINKIQILVNINPLLFTLMVFSIVFISFFFLYELNIYFLAFLLVVAYSITILVFIKKLIHIIDFVLKVFGL
ncbi:MAG: hypothetical protein DRJ10_19575 [Bacteroidetes bacterium]|nr:MAG: hypothetical protein DRJ10_19575 [Bacteroidota bacterium]